MTEYILSQAQRTVGCLIKHNMTVSSAESCTGGLLSAAITSVPGASAVIGLGICSYSAEMKQKILGVPPEVIECHGTVSRETADEMAKRVRELSGADIGVSITGSAGPEPAEGKAPGTVFIGISSEKLSYVKKLTLDSPGRMIVRETAVYEALAMISDLLES